MRWGRGHFEGPQPPLHAQFSKDVLVSIYSAYVDNFLNAKDAVRVAKEARPAFLKFLEVPRPGRGRRPPSPRASRGDLPLDVAFFACCSSHGGLPALFWGFSKACGRTRRSRRCPTS